MGNRLEGSYHHRYFASVQELVRRRSEESLMFRQLSAMTVTEPASGAEVPLKTIRDLASIRFTAGRLMALDPAVLDPVVAGNWLDGYDVRETLARVACPTLLLQADPQRGGMLTNEDAQLTESLIRDCERVQIPGCAHLIHGLQPAETARFTLRFLASLPSQGSNPC